MVSARDLIGTGDIHVREAPSLLYLFMHTRILPMSHARISLHTLGLMDLYGSAPAPAPAPAASDDIFGGMMSAPAPAPAASGGDDMFGGMMSAPAPAPAAPGGVGLSGSLP